MRIGCLGLRVFLLLGLFGKDVGGVCRIEEAGGLLQKGDVAQALDRLARVEEACGKGRARIVAQAGEHRVHPLDLGLLIGDDITGELEHHRIGGGTWQIGQILHHGQRALVMFDHQLQELAVEPGAAQRGQFGHVLGAGHAFHAGVVHVSHPRHL